MIKRIDLTYRYTTVSPLNKRHVHWHIARYVAPKHAAGIFVPLEITVIDDAHELVIVPVGTCVIDSCFNRLQ